MDQHDEDPFSLLKHAGEALTKIQEAKRKDQMFAAEMKACMAELDAASEAMDETRFEAARAKLHVLIDAVTDNKWSLRTWLHLNLKM